ncbi:uncharacterized protein LOC144451374 [Glandiceps talaboti]
MAKMANVTIITLVLLLTVMACLPSLGHSFFMPTLPLVDKDKVTTKWNSYQTSRGEWQLSMDIEWALPEGFTNGMEFLVRLTQESSHCSVNSTLPVTSEEDKMKCQTSVFRFVEKATDFSVKNNAISLSGLDYGYTYTIQIAVKDASNDTGSPACPETKAPDCYSETGSREFCHERCTPLCSPPIGLTVVDVVGDDENGETANVTVSWLRPIQHNDNIHGYTLEFINLQTTNNEVSNIVKEISSNDDMVPIVVTASGVKVNISYQITVMVFARGLQGELVHGPRTSIEYIVEPDQLFYSDGETGTESSVSIAESTTTATADSRVTIGQTSTSNKLPVFSSIMLTLVVAGVHWLFD